VYENTKLADDWRHGAYRALDLADYVGLAADVLERIPPTTYVQRLTGEISSSGVLAPHWGRKKLQVINAISDELARRGTWQGFRHREPEVKPGPVAPFRRKGIGA
jgi:radical SAM superfamily enzyme